MTITKINDNLSLIQDPKGLTFGTDAYLLSAFVSGGANLVGADLGSGTGIIPLLLANYKKAKLIYALEIQESFSDLIGQNARLNGFEEIIKPICCDIRELNSPSLGGEVDFVTANPPYMKSDSGKKNEHGEKFIARHEVCGNIGDFCAAASRLLKYGGRFYCVYRPDRLADLIVALRESRLEPKLITFVKATAGSEPSMLLVRAIKGAASSLTVTRDLILHSSQDDAKNNTLSIDAQNIYERCSFEKF